MTTYTPMLAILFWFAVFFIVYTYILYPLILFLLTTGRKPPVYATPNEWPSVSIIIAAHNEEAIIREKIENTLDLDYPCLLYTSDAADE